MSRYIDANKLKKSLSIPCASIIEIGETIIAQIDDQPTADVVEVVRCKDCKKREHCRTTNTWAVAPSDDWFCADGERAEK